MELTVRQFINQAYRLINASNPVVPLHGDDQQLAISVLNQLLQSYASSGLMMTIAKTVSVDVNLGIQEIIFTASDFIPPFDPTVVQIAEGRMANLDNAWLLLTGVTYPLIDKSRDDYLAAWKYEPLQGLPRFIITFPDTDIVRARLYPAPSQFFQFNCRGKFQIGNVGPNDDMSSVPQYYHLYFMYAVMKHVCQFKGRNDAWRADLEATYRELKDNMESSSEVNLSIIGDEQSLLNGAWRVRAGI